MNFSKRLLTVAAMAFAVITVTAQNLVAYHVVGKVTYISQGSTLPLVMNTKITPQTIVNIPYGGKLELLDEKGSRRITLKNPGRGTVKALSESEDKSVSKLSSKYVAYVKKQLTNKGLTSRQRYTDMATVTRQRDSLPENNSQNSFEAKFREFQKQSRDKYTSFRDKCNKEYIDFVRKAWKEFGQDPPQVKPEEPRVEPVVFDDKKQDRPIDRRRLEEKSVEPAPQDDHARDSQPQPIQEIEQQQESPIEKEFSGMPFSFFGTDMQVRLDETKRLNIGEISPDRIADLLGLLSSKEYDNLLYDCLKLRSDRKLCDWAYLLMLKEIADQFCGQGTNEATLLLGWLYCQSGYKARFATDGSRLGLLIASKHSIYDKGAYNVDGDKFYPIDDISGSMHICEASFPQEKGLSLYINAAQNFGNENFDEREIKSKRYPDTAIKVKIRKGLIDFYNTYPTSYVNDDFTTRWAMYADTPMDDSVKAQIYPVLAAELSGLNPLEATEHLLNFVQTGLEYGYDDEIWGGDRAFFAEETLHYPYCDCEDRSILFTRLVRDLLGLDCVLVYYPGHLASAVNFPTGLQVSGDYYSLGGKDYTVCDPTYINAGVGMQMPGYGEGAVLIPLSK